MALRIKKWIPETQLRAINYGNGRLQFNAYLTNDETRKGKTFIVEPKSDLYVLVKDLIPVSPEELSKLGEDEVSFTLVNIGTETSTFNIFDEGPFYSEVLTRKYDNDAQRHIDYYQEAIQNDDAYRMKQLIKEPVSEQWKSNRFFYAAICMFRGQIFRSFMQLPESEASFEAGWEGFEDKNKWWYSFEWMATYLAYLVSPQATAAEKGKAMQKAIEILNRTDKLVEGLKYQKHHHMAAACVRAFMLCYLGEEEQALAQFDDFDFTPLSTDEYHEEELNSFFRYLAYGFWTGLEMKNAELLRNLSSIISTGFPDMLHEPSPVRCFRRAFGNADQKGRNQLNKEVQNLTLTAHNYAPEFPNLRQFVTYLNNKDGIALDNFIAFVE